MWRKSIKKMAVTTALLVSIGGGGTLLFATSADAGTMQIYGDANYSNPGGSYGTYSGTNGWWGNFTGGCDGGSTWNDCVSSSKNLVGTVNYFYVNVACAGGYYAEPNNVNVVNMANNTYNNGIGLNDSISSDSVGGYVSSC